MTATIHIVGGVQVDLIMGPVAPWPRPGSETFVAHSELRAGGPAGNTALALAALGVPYRLVGGTGDDAFGAFLRQGFSAAGAALATVPGATGLSVAVEHPGGERSFLTAAGHLSAETAANILALLPGRAGAGDVVLISGAFLFPQLLDGFEALCVTIRRRGFALALDTGWPPDGWTDTVRTAATAWLAQCDHVLLNEVEAASLSGAAEIEAAMAWVAAHARPDAAVIVKRGGEGVSALAAGRRLDCPAPAVTVIDTTGAGDAFNAGYLAALVGGRPLEDCLRRGVAVASAAIASLPRTYAAPN